MRDVTPNTRRVRSGLIAAAVAFLTGIQSPTVEATGAGTAVGSIAGKFAVEKGAASYSIPLAVPPGVAGMQPELSINYSSQGGNGPLGVGFTLGGLSAISRCPRTWAQDNAKGGIKFDDGDRFCLDGQRLIPLTDGGTEYRTEIDGYSRIKSHGAGPAHWTVETKSGQTIEYGNTQESNFVLPGKTAALSWAVNQITDSVGNELTVDYENDAVNGEHRPTTIDYGSNSIVIDYEERTDTSIGYVSGAQIKNNHRISQIRVLSSGTELLTYKFSYGESQGTGRSLLTQIEQCDGNDNCLPSTQFTFRDNSGVGDFDAHIDDSHGEGNQGDKVSWVDINGDGLDDWVRARSSSMRVRLSSGDGTFGPIIDSPHDVSGQDDGVTWVDVNADGLADWVRARSSSTRVRLSNGDGTFGPIIDSPHGKSNQDNRVSWLDANADGRIDWLRADDAKTRVRLGNGDGTFGPMIESDHGRSGENSNVTWADINGDGLIDWLRPKSGFTRVRLSNGDGTFGPIIDSSHGVSDQDERVSWVDVNGYGLADWLRAMDSRARIRLSKGDGTFGPIIDSYHSEGSQKDNVSWLDVNADGLTDWVRRKGSKLRTRLSLGDGTFGPFIDSPNSIGDNPEYSSFADINGDGLIDQVRAINSHTRVSLQTAPIAGHLVSITNGLGTTTSIDYLPITQSSVYEKRPQGDAPSDYPKMDLQIPMYAVSKVTSDNGIGGTSSASYRYGGLKAHLRGRGLLGYAWIKTTDDQTGITSLTNYRQDFPFAGMVSSTEQFLAEGTKIGSTSASYETCYSTECENEYSADPLQAHVGRIFEVRSTQSVEEGRDLYGSLLSTVTTTNSDFDEFGNIKTIVVTTSGNGETYTKTTNNAYENNEGSWHLGRLTSASVTHHHHNGTQLTRSSSFSYDPATGLLLTETVEPGSQDELTTTYSYDGFGNKTTATLSAPGLIPRTTTTTYDTSGRFPITTSNSLGHSETRVFDPLCGKAISHTGPNNITTSWEYDDLCRKVKEIRADGTETLFSQAWADGDPDAPEYAKYKSTTISTGSAPTSVWYDALGRKIRKQNVGFNGNTVYQDTIYNHLGQITKKSMPYYQGAPTYWVESSYDIIGRVEEIKQLQSDGSYATTSYDYNGFSTTETKPLGQFKTTIKNALGKTARVEEPEGSWIDYSYDATGNLISTNSNGVITSMEYDLRGRKKAMDDPAMGHWSYDYNAYGELTSQTDAKLQTVTMEYDTLGRMAKRIDPDLSETTWTYDTANHGIGKVAQVASPQVTKSYSYDSLGRSTEVEQNIGGQQFTSGVGYDALGRAYKEIHPDGVVIERSYNDHGYLKSVRMPKEQVLDYDYSQLESALTIYLDELTVLQTQRQVHVQQNLDYLQAADDYRLQAEIYLQLGDAAEAEAVALLEAVQELEALAVVEQQKADEYQQLYLDHFQKYGDTIFEKDSDIMGDGTEDYRAHVSGKWRHVYLDSVALLEDGGSLPATLNVSAFYAEKAALYQSRADGYEQQAANNPAAAAALNAQAADYRAQAAQMEQLAISTIALAEQELAIVQQIDADLEDIQTAAADIQAQLDEHNGDDQYVLLWSATSRDAAGRLKGELAGNGLLTHRSFDPYSGRLTHQNTALFMANPIRDMSYEYNARDSVTRRTDSILNIDEQFTYDSFDRLVGAHITADDPDLAGTITYGYDVHGNMVQKTDIGDMVYDGANRLTQLTKNGGAVENYSYDLNGNLLQGGGRNITWTSFNKPLQIQKGSSTLNYTYGSGRERVRLDSTTDGKLTTTYYAGKGFEQETTVEDGKTIVRKKHTIFAGNEAVSVQIRTQIDGVEQPDQTRYMHRDALGNVDTITDGSGDVVIRSSFDAFGKRRATHIVQTDLPEWAAKSLVRRGFTGHEELQEVGLVHMNGRVYDPDVARFLSADPNMQSPTTSQGYNRYSYVQNNPLKYTDPSGYFLKKLFKGIKKLVKKILSNPVLRAVAVIAGAYFAGLGMLNYLGYGSFGAAAAATSACTAISAGAMVGGTAALAMAGAVGGFVGGFIGSGGDLRSAFIGGITGGVAGYIGAAIANPVARVFAHGVNGGVSSRAQGGKFLHGFLSNSLVKSISGKIHNYFGENHIGGAVASAVVGGAATSAMGGKFANGAVTGGFAYLFSNAGTESRYDENGILKEQYRGEVIASSPRTSALWEIPQPVVDVAAGFGDTFGAGYIRGWLGINGGVNYDSNYYSGGQIAGIFTPGMGTAAALRVTAAVGGTRAFRVINGNRYLRLGPGRMPANGSFSAGSKVPRMSVGKGPGNPHFDLRVRFFD